MSVLSVIGVVFSTAAMVVVLSGFGGLKNYTLEFVSNISPETKIVAKSGKGFVLEKEMVEFFYENQIVFNKTLEEKALIDVNGNSKIITIMCVDKNFPENKIEALMYEGSWPDKNGDYFILGWENFYNLGVSINNVTNPVTFYVPKPGSGQITTESDILRSKRGIASGVFSINEELNNNLIITSFNFGKHLFQTDERFVSSIDLHETTITKEQQNDFIMLFGDGFLFKNSIQQNDSLYKMLKSEELAVFFIFSLIMLVALFNMFASLSMMFMEKRKNLNTLLALGTKKIDIAKIFFLNGVYTTFFGLGLGLILGSVLVFLQLKLSLLMITETLAYPVSFDFQNYINVIIITFLLGLIASFSVSSYVKKWLD